MDMSIEQLAWMAYITTQMELKDWCDKISK